MISCAILLFLLLAAALKVHADASIALAEHASKAMAAHASKAKAVSYYRGMLAMYMNPPIQDIRSETWAYKPLEAEALIRSERLYLEYDAEQKMEMARRDMKEKFYRELAGGGYFQEFTDRDEYTGSTRLRMRLFVCHPKDVQR
jgi:hypothetical protein